MIAPKLQKTPRWAPTLDGRPFVTWGVFYGKQNAIEHGRLRVESIDRHRIGAARVWVAFE